MAVFVQLLPVERDTGVQDGIELVAATLGQEQLHQLVQLRRVVDLITAERRLEVVQPLRVSLFHQDRGPVVAGECNLDRVGVIVEVQQEGIVLLWVCSFEVRERVHRLDARQNLVHVHRVQQRLIVAGLELVGADQEAVRLFLNLVGDQVLREAVHGCRSDLCAVKCRLSREGGYGQVGIFMKSRMA